MGLVDLFARVCDVWPNAQFYRHELKACGLLRRKFPLQFGHVSLDELSVVALEVRHCCGKEVVNGLDGLNVFLTERLGFVEVNVGKRMMKSSESISLSLRQISCETQKFTKMIVRKTL